jgi:hypothetical protein
LTQPRAAEPLIKHLDAVYLSKFEKKPEGFVTTATDGASIVA